MSNIIDLTKPNPYNWDNEFSVRFKMDKGNQLKYVPNSIFMMELPSLVMTDMAGALVMSEMENISQEIELDNEKYLKLTLRCTKDKSVEKEVFSSLMNNKFNLEISLDNPNITEFEFNDCSVSKIEYAPLIRRQKSNFYNFIVYIKVSQVKYHIGDEVISFGDAPIDYMSLVDNKGVKNDKL